MEAIEAFWDWWTAEGRAALSEAIISGEATDLPDQITGLVTAIHPELAWQLAPGSLAKHALTVSPDGSLELRAITEVWRATGPPADEEWEYHAARQPHDGPIVAAGIELNPAEVRFDFEWDELYEQLDLVVDHPSFDDLDAETSLEVAFAAVEAVLGEDGVERWVGIVDIAAEPSRRRALTELPEIVARFSPTVTGAQWERLETTSVSGWEEHLVLNRALKAIDNLAHNVHLEVRISLTDHDRLGLPTSSEATQLEAMARSLDDALGSKALPMATDTVNRTHSLHYFVNDVDTVEEVVDEWIDSQPDRTIEAMFMIDPAWNNAHRWD